jgi:hypothetical protein
VTVPAAKKPAAKNNPQAQHVKRQRAKQHEKAPADKK